MNTLDSVLQSYFSLIVHYHPGAALVIVTFTIATAVLGSLHALRIAAAVFGLLLQYAKVEIAQTRETFRFVRRQLTTWEVEKTESAVGSALEAGDGDSEQTV